MTGALTRPSKSAVYAPAAARRWRAAAYLGLVSSTFSTIVSQLSAARIGRDAAVDWMIVATIPGSDNMLSSGPTPGSILVGILFHQWADFSWALFFFGVLGKWTAGLNPISLIVLAVPWAFLTSAIEWFVLVPLFRFGSRSLRCSSPTGSAFSYTSHRLQFIRCIAGWMAPPLGTKPERLSFAYGPRRQSQGLWYWRS